MSKDIGREKKKKNTKAKRLKIVLGVDLCACGPNHKMKCDGPCREAHTDPNTGDVKCFELYQIDPKLTKVDDRKGRRQKSSLMSEKNEHDAEKQKRRNKFIKGDK